MAVSDFAEITTSKPELLFAPMSKSGGRNNRGRITVATVVVVTTTVPYH